MNLAGIPSSDAMMHGEALRRPPVRRVAFIQRRLPHYRLPLFSALAAAAADRGLAITFYSAEPPDPRIPARFPYRVCPPVYVRGATGPYWMRGLVRSVRGADIVIAPQEMRSLTVLWLWLRRRRVARSWIWFGHGYNTKLRLRPAGRPPFVERLREVVTPRATGLITYTEAGAEHWRQRGLNRVRAFGNTIDVEGFRRFYRGAKRQARILKRELGIDGRVVLLYCGRIYEEKRLDLLIDAFARLRARNPDVALLVVGDGAARAAAEARVRAAGVADVHFLGEIVDPASLAVPFAAADLLVIPGLVGLAIVQGFAFGLPLATTDYKGHSPEFEYLTAENGIVTAMEADAYAAGIEALVRAPDRLRRLKKGAWASGTALRLDASVARFLDAVEALADAEEVRDASGHAREPA